MPSLPNERRAMRGEEVMRENGDEGDGLRLRPLSEFDGESLLRLREPGEIRRKPRPIFCCGLNVQKVA